MCAVAKQKEKFAHYIPSAGRCPDTFWEAGPQQAQSVALDDKCHKRKCSPSSSFPSACIAECDVIWYGIFLWSVWVSCPSCVISQAFPHTQTTGLRDRGWRDSLGGVQVLISNSRNTALHKCEAQHYAGCSEKN